MPSRLPMPGMGIKFSAPRVPPAKSGYGGIGAATRSRWAQEAAEEKLLSQPAGTAWADLHPPGYSVEDYYNDAFNKIRDNYSAGRVNSPEGQAAQDYFKNSPAAGQEQGG